MSPTENRLELLQGTLDMLILRTLQWGSQHGHGIGQAIRQSSADLLHIERGSLYPALHRLEGRGLISSEWKNSDLNRRAKYYQLTAAGRKQLVTEQSKWKLFVRAISRVMRPAQGKLSNDRWRFWRREQRDADLDDEIAFDLAAEAEERIRSGIPREEAEWASRRGFGNVLLLKEDVAKCGAGPRCSGSARTFVMAGAL